MNVPFWEPAREYRNQKSEIDSAIDSCLERGELVLGFGEEINKFEKAFADFIGVKHAIMSGSGTQSLCLAYSALDIKPGDEVITTSHTFIATIDQIVKLGAKPVLVDIGEDGLIDPDKIERAITEKTVAIVPVHLEGKVCDMERIMEIAIRNKLLVIEDSAQAIGASYKGKKAGSIGHAGCYSFYPAKVLGCVGNAGAVVTNDDDVADRVRMLRCNYNIGKNESLNVEYGWNLEPDAIQAAVLNVRLKYLEGRLARRKEIAQKYDEAFKELPFIKPTIQDGRIYQDYVIRFRDTDERNDVKKFLNENGIKTLGDNLRPNHHYYTLGLDFQLPKTVEYIHTQMRLPCNPDMTEEEADYVIQKVKEFYA